jgi:hypothetical protein
VIAPAAALILLFGFAILGAFTLLEGYATARQVREEKRTELYDWSQEPDL